MMELVRMLLITSFMSDLTWPAPRNRPSSVGITYNITTAALSLKQASVILVPLEGSIRIEKADDLRICQESRSSFVARTTYVFVNA